MGTKSSATGKVILGIILSLNITSALALDSRFQKVNSGNALNVDSLNITNAEATDIRNNAAIYLTTASSYGDLSFSMVDSTANFTNNNIARAVRVSANQSGIDLGTTITRSSINLFSAGGSPGNVIGVLSEGGVGAIGQTHSVALDTVVVSVTSTNSKDAGGIFVWSYSGAEQIDISLSGINNITAKSDSGDAKGIETGSSLETNITETNDGGVITAETSGSLKTSYGINVNTINGINTVSIRSTIDSSSADGTAYGISILGNSTNQVSENSVTTRGNIKVSADVDAYGISISNGNFKTFKNNINQIGNLDIDSSTGNAYGIYSIGNDTTITSSGSIDVDGDNGIGIYSDSTGDSTITTNSNITVSGATSGTAIYNRTTTGTNIINVIGGNVEGSTVGIEAISTSGETTIANQGIINGATAGIKADNTGGEQKINNSGNISSVNGQAILSTNTNGKTTINNQGIVTGATAGIQVASTGVNGEQIISNSGNISSANDLALSSTNASSKTTINNNNGGNITGYANIAGTDVTFNNNANATLDLKNFATGTKGIVTYTIGNAGLGMFDNAGIIKFSDDNFDNTNTHAVFDVATFTNSGVIDLTGKNPTGATAEVGDTFTINGDYVSNGGSIRINTELDDASSNGGLGISDRLIINGNVNTGSGATNVFVTPTANSLGQLTTGKGIKIIEITGTSSINAFVLGKPLTSGAYEYVLGQDSNTGGPIDHNWYLTSFLRATNQILYNPAVASYLNNQTAAVEMFQQTLFDRITSSTGSVSVDAHERFLWLRTTMNHGSRRSMQASMSNRGRSYMVQFGSDLALWRVNDGFLHVGVMGGYGDAKDTSTSRSTRTKTDGKVKGYSAGLYSTWFQQQETYLGLYIDVWSQMGWYRNEVSGASQVATKKYNSTVWSSSVETGYGVSIGKTAKRDWVVTPQLQLVYNLYDADNLYDKNNLYITNNNASGVITRTGIKFSANSLDKRVLEPFVEVNWLHSTAKNELDFNGQTLKDGMPRNRFESKVGLRGNLNDRWSVSAQVGGQWGQNHFNQYEGQFNVNYLW